MNLKRLLWHPECAEYAFLKIVSLHNYFCRYLNRCGKSCFAIFCYQGPVNKLNLPYLPKLTMYTTFLIRIPQIGIVFFEPPNLHVLSFTIFIFVQKAFPLS